MAWPGAVHYWVDDNHGCSSTTVDAGCLQQEKQLEKKLGPQVPIMSTHGRSAEAPIMAVGSAEEQRIMSTSTRLRLKRRPNIMKDAAQSFSFSRVSNKQHDGGVLQSIGFANIVLQFKLSLGPAAHAAAYPSKLVYFLQFGFCSIMLDIAMNFLMENSFQIFAGSMNAEKRLTVAEIVQKCVLRAV